MTSRAACPDLDDDAGEVIQLGVDPRPGPDGTETEPYSPTPWRPSIDPGTSQGTWHATTSLPGPSRQSLPVPCGVPVLSPFATPRWVRSTSKVVRSHSGALGRGRRGGAGSTPATHALQMPNCFGDFRYYRDWDLWSGTPNVLGTEGTSATNSPGSLPSRMALTSPHLWGRRCSCNSTSERDEPAGVAYGRDCRRRGPGSPHHDRGRHGGRSGLAAVRSMPILAGWRRSSRRAGLS